jgi:hypothetical protein
MSRDDAKPDIGLGKVEIRHMLLLAGDEPLRAAVALRHDGHAIITLDRRKPPRTLERELKEAVPDSHEHRFGTFSQDTHDPRLARFVVNRAAPGMARKLVMALRGTGMRRVEIGTEDGRETDAAENDDNDEHAQSYDPAAHQRALDDEKAAEHAALTRLLSDLAHHIVAASGEDHARKALLTQMAEAAQARLKQDDLAQAAHAIRALRDALV